MKVIERRPGNFEWVVACKLSEQQADAVAEALNRCPLVTDSESVFVAVPDEYCGNIKPLDVLVYCVGNVDCVSRVEVTDDNGDGVPSVFDVVGSDFIDN